MGSTANSSQGDIHCADNCFCCTSKVEANKEVPIGQVMRVPVCPNLLVVTLGIQHSCALLVDNNINVWDLQRPYIPFGCFTEHKDVTTSWIQSCLPSMQAHVPSCTCLFRFPLASGSQKIAFLLQGWVFNVSYL